MSLNTMLELLDSMSPQCEQLCRQEHHQYSSIKLKQLVLDCCDLFLMLLLSVVTRPGNSNTRKVEEDITLT